MMYIATNPFEVCGITQIGVVVENFMVTFS